MNSCHIKTFGFSASAAVWIASISFTPFAGAQGANDLRNRFLREAPAGWDAIRVNLERAQGSYFVKFTIDGKLAIDLEFEVKQNSRCKMNMTKDAITQKDTLEVYNSLYSFTLTKKTPKGQWLLGDLNLKEKSKKHAAYVDGSISRGWLCQPICLPPISLADLIRSPTFRILSARAVQKDKLSLVEVSFDNKHNIDRKPFCPIQGGKLYLEPARSWCLRSAIIDAQYSNGGGTHYHELMLVEDAPSLCIPRELVVRKVGYVIPDGKTISEKKSSNAQIEVKYKINVPSTLPADEEFTLTAFGLPEPMGMPPVNRGVRWWLWITLAAVGSVGFAILFRRLRRRYQGQISEPVET